MNLYILSSKIKNRYLYDGVVLNEDDFDPFKPFWINHPNLKPEKFDYIYIKGVLEKHDYLRCVLKICDYLIKKGGIIELDYFNAGLTSAYSVRSVDEISYEISLVFKNRIVLFEENKGLILNRKYRKIEESLPLNDSITKWSFGIVSDGRKNERILQIVDRISKLKIPEYEVLICGPSPSNILPDFVKVIDDSDCYNDIRIPICKKKNKIITNAKFNNLVIIHDRIMFPLDWYEKISKYGNYFDTLSLKILDEVTLTKNVNDYLLFSDETFGVFKDINMFKKKKWSSKLFIDGSIFIIKKHIALQNQLSDYLNWGEKEDVDFSKRLYLNGFLYFYYDDCYVTSMTYSKKGNTQRDGINSLIYFLRCYFGWHIRKINENREFNKIFKDL